MDMPGREEHLLEYEKLKDEQIARITARDNLLNYNLVALAALATVAATVKSTQLGLLAAPWISSILGWAYLQHDAKITAIGRHLRSVDASRSFGWERSVKQIAFPRAIHKAVSVGMLLLAFAMPSIAGPLTWFISSQIHANFLLGVAVAEIALGVFIGVVMVKSADLVAPSDYDPTQATTAGSP